MTFEQLMALLVFLGGGATAFFTWLTKSYFPQRAKLQEMQLTQVAEQEKAKLEEAARQREHEREMARRAAEEQERQREHERGLAKARAEAETSGEGNIWQQMVNLQTKLMGQNEQFSDFIIHLATDRADATDKNAREDMRAIAEKWTANSYELREVRTSLSILVQEAATRERDREGLKKLPGYILDLIARQEVFYNQVQELLNGRHYQLPNPADREASTDES